MRVAQLLWLALPGISLAQQIAIGEYTVPTPNSGPLGIAAGPDGAMWFTENHSGKIGRIAPSGAITEYPVSTGPTSPDGIAAGPDGALWFADYGGKAIGRIATSGAVTEYPVTFPGPDPLPMGIAAGPDGRMWYTLAINSSEVIGAITTAGDLTPYPASCDYANSIAAGSDGALWFTCFFNAAIQRITTSGSTSSYSLPTQSPGLESIAAGPDGALWFTENTANQIGRITTAGVVSEYPVPTPSSGLMGITAGPDGTLWFTESSVNQIGRITTTGGITEYPLPEAAGSPNQIAAGPGGTLWFTDSYGRIGEVVFVTANLNVSPPSGFYRSTLTFKGSRFAPHETVQIYYQGVGSNVLASATADAEGLFTVTAQAPQSPNGPRLFLGVGQSSAKLGAAGFSMASHLVLSPTSGPPGAAVTVDGYGFDSFENVGLYWNNAHTPLGQAITNAAGTFNGSTALTFTVPAGAPTGPNAVLGHGSPAGPIGSAVFTVQ